MKLTAILCLFPLTVLSTELPKAILPEGVGVNIHFVTGHERDLDLIAAAGFKWVRMDFAWGSIERKKGEFDWSAYDELSSNLEKHGLRAIYILDYSNPLYEEKVESRNGQHTEIVQRDTASPRHPESIAAYSRWAAAAVQHFHGRHLIWEIWNEPNGFFWKPKPDAEQYTALALSAAKSIREAEPGVTLVGPALAGFQPKFMETFLKSGVLNYLDAVSVHPYRDSKKPPETVRNDYNALRAMIRSYAAQQGAKNVPIISGEWGYTSKMGGVSPEIQAAYLVRQQLFNLLCNVPLSIWYDWQNDGTDANKGEHNFGTVSDTLSPKPAYTAVKVLTRELAGFSILETEDIQDNDFLMTMSNASGHKKLVAWTAAEPHEVTINRPFKPTDKLTGINGMGEAFTPQIKEGRFVIELESMPKYIGLK